MPFICLYDELFDEYFQSEISQETADKARPVSGVDVRDTPFPNVDIKSRYRSDRHPGWDD